MIGRSVRHFESHEELDMNHRMKSGALTLSLIALAACSDTAGLESTSEESLTLDVAMIAADAAIDEFGDMGRLFGGGGPHGGTHTATFYDVDGMVQDALDPLTTASIHLVVESTHEFARDTWSGTGTRSRDVMITGLLGEEEARTVNGTGSASMTRSQHADEDGTTRSYSMAGSSSMVDVVHPVPRTEDAWPLSGTITRDVTINVINGPNGDVTKTRTVVIIFNGTNLPTMTVDGEPFEVDMSARSGRRPFRRHGQ
jgi:hypothetical protein